jgi:hypothetical protein
LAAFWIIELDGGFPVVVRDEAAAEFERFELHNGGQCEGVKLAEPAAFVEKLRHGVGGEVF